MSRCAVIEDLEKESLKKDIPDFAVGDTIAVHFKIVEGNKERIQVFTGTVIARKGGGFSETVTLYRVSYGSGVERVFPLHSPRIEKIVVSRKGKVRRSKLYYLRGVSGKKAKVKEQLGGKVFIEETKASAEKPEAPEPEPQPAS